MSELIAKTIVNDSYYIVIDGSNKVGNVLVKDNGVFLTVNKTTTQYASTQELSKKAKITFASSAISVKENNIITYPAPKTTYNHLYDSKLKLQLFTNDPDSKSYRAAGYFAIKIADEFEVMYCPKHIYLTRYKFSGPFHTIESATEYVKSTG
jgi:hypothetical protein